MDTKETLVASGTGTTSGGGTTGMFHCTICTKPGIPGKTLGGLFHNTRGRIERLIFCVPLFSCAPGGQEMLEMQSLGCVECQSILKTVEAIDQESPVGLYALLCDRCKNERERYALLGCHNCGSTGSSNLRACTGCGYARYCSEGCQKEDWKASHKNVCSLVSKVPGVKNSVNPETPSKP